MQSRTGPQQMAKMDNDKINKEISDQTLKSSHKYNRYKNNNSKQMIWKHVTIHRTNVFVTV